MIETFYRIKRLPPYVFAQVQALKLDARNRGEARARILFQNARELLNQPRLVLDGVKTSHGQQDGPALDFRKSPTRFGPAIDLVI